MSTISGSTGSSTGAFFERASLDISSLRAQAEALQKRLGSGEALTRSSDNPVAASRLRALARADAMASVDATNANRATADLKLADGALSSVVELVTRARELATQAASATYSPSQRVGIGAEIAQIHQGLLALANSQDSAGHSLFGGEATGPAYTVDASGNAVYAGTASAGELPIGDGLNVKRSIIGPDFLNATVNGKQVDLLAVVKSLADALQSGAADAGSAAKNALDPLADALEGVNVAQTIIGTRLTWIELATDRQTNLSETRAGEQAQIGAPDIASTVADLQHIMLVLEASQASFAQLAKLSLFDRVG